MTTIPTGVIRIERVVAQLEVWLDDAFPFAKMKVKVIDRGNSDYLAIANLLFLDPTTGETDTEAGLGDTPEEAVSDFLKRFWHNANERFKSDSFDERFFAWAAHEDF